MKPEAGERKPTNLQAEPPYPGLECVVFALKTKRCKKDYPHLISECGEFKRKRP